MSETTPPAAVTHLRLEVIVQRGLGYEYSSKPMKPFISDIAGVSEYFSDNDYVMFERIVGHSLEALIFDLQAMPPDDRWEIFSQKKVLEWPELNKKGLHVFRSLLAERVLDDRIRKLGLWDSPDHLEYLDQGILVKKNFLKPGELERFLAKGLMPRKAVKRIIHMINCCVGTKRLDEEFKLQNTKAREDYDIQWDWHVDTYHPMIKLWFYVADTSIDHGPLHFAPGSHRSTETKMRWLHECATSGCDPDHPLFHRRYGGGSFRVDMGGDPDKLIEEFGFERISLEGAANTLVLADTNGFHRRGVTQKGYVRRMMHASHRVSPFESMVPKGSPFARGNQSVRRLGRAGMKWLRNESRTKSA